MSLHNKHGLLGPQLLGLGAGLLSQGFTKLPQTGFEGLGRGLQFAQQFGNQAQQQQMRQQILQNQTAQQGIANDFAQQRLGLAQERLGIARAGAGQTSLLKNLAAADAADKAGNPAQANAIRAAMSAPRTQVNIVNEGRKAGSKEFGKLTAQSVHKSLQDASAAQLALGDNLNIAAALSNPNVFMGAGGDVVQNMKEIGQALGFNMSGVADGQVMQVLGNRVAIQLQKDMPLGKLTDKDVQLLKSMTTSLNKTPETNRRLLLLSNLALKLKVEKGRIGLAHLEDGEVSPQVYTAWARADAAAVKQMKVHIQAMRSEQNQLAPRSPGVGISFTRMNRQQLDGIDASTLTTGELLQWLTRDKELKSALQQRGGA